MQNSWKTPVTEFILNKFGGVESETAAFKGRDVQNYWEGGEGTLYGET